MLERVATEYMMSLDTPSPVRTAATWGVATTPSAPISRRRMLPDASLSPDVGVAADAWRSSGERAIFVLEFEGDLPAGWYMLDGGLRSVEGRPMEPCLYPSYASGADGDAQIPLPDCGNQGAIRSLVLFKHAVAGLRFCPTQGPSRFRMGDLSLRRASRLAALARMLGATRRMPGGTALRTLRFAVAALRSGLSQATDALYRDYRRRLLPDNVGDYAGWVARFDSLTAERMDELHARAGRLGSDGPLVSILLPVYQTPERWLRRCIESVIAQAYPNWQLCIVDDASPDARIMQVVQEYARQDERIEAMRRERNGHISEASNSALALARGDFMALLDHDDELRPHALLEMAEAIVADPEVGLVYSDEDKIDADGRRFDPYFKPDWDPDLLLGQNYVCHFTAIRTGLVRAAGGFRQGFEGSQDHDLILRCSERLRPDQVKHIPKVLYHWRAIPGSTALRRDAKDYAATAGARAVAEHLDRCQPGARVEGLPHGHYRVHWPLPEPAPKVSLVIPTRDKVELLRMCVESILGRTRYPCFELVVVDNQSSDPQALSYLTELERLERVKVLRYDAPFNYSAINNWAVKQCDGTIIGLVNNDIEVISGDWLDEMASQALRPGIGAVGAMLYYPNDTIQHGGVVLGMHGVAAHLYVGMPRGYSGQCGRARVAQGLSAVTGACLLVGRAAYDKVGGLDEALSVAFNDVDFCLRLRQAGYRNIWTPFAELRHHESASRGSEDTPEKRQRFENEVELMQKRWGDALRYDPAYNPNLTLQGANFELAFPPRQDDGPRATELEIGVMK